MSENATTAAATGSKAQKATATAATVETDKAKKTAEALEKDNADTENATTPQPLPARKSSTFSRTCKPGKASNCPTVPP